MKKASPCSPTTQGNDTGPEGAATGNPAASRGIKASAESSLRGLTQPSFRSSAATPDRGPRTAAAQSPVLARSVKLHAGQESVCGGRLLRGAPEGSLGSASGLLQVLTIPAVSLAPPEEGRCVVVHPA